MDSIIVEQLVRRFNGFTAVNGVTFRVADGELFGFLGPNGAGKSTTISMLCTLLKPTAGTATVNGYDIREQPNEVRQSIGLIFQDPSVDTQLTALENLDFHARIYNLPRRGLAERMEALLRMVELWERRNDLVKTFSGGMRRRLEIARGLLHHPRVLFLDEPTIGLDPQTREHIWHYLNALREREGVTLFLTTHYMDEAERCDRIAIIDHGSIVAIDTPARLKSMVGGDVITLRTAAPEISANRVRERFGLDATATDGELRIEVANGESFIPELVQALDMPIQSISLRRPTLEDVFLKLTGRAMRDEEAGATENMRNMARAWTRRR